MIKVKEYRGHIRNWEALCEELKIDPSLAREEREEAILIKAFETWRYDMADHMHGMFAFALWDDKEEELFCLRDPFGTKPFYYYVTEDGNLLYGTMIRQIMDQKVLGARHRLALNMEKMKGLSPIGKLNQGFSYVEGGTDSERRVVKSIHQVQIDEQISVYVTDGIIYTAVTSVKEEMHGREESCE